LSWFLLFAQLLVRSFLSVPVTAVAGFALLLFGYEFIPLGGQVVISAESAPPGSWQITFLPPLDRDEHRIVNKEEYSDTGFLGGRLHELEETLERNWKQASRGIFHSRGYNDPRAFSVIIEWLGSLSSGMLTK
jgi:hypothetical protein